MKKKLAIVSVLKPVDDPRNYKKIGISLAETNKYEINIIGFYTKSIPAYPNIYFYPVFNFTRTSIKRLAASWKIHKLLLKVKPDLIIANTHEILIVITIHKILFGTKILYDIQENYFRNILSTRAFPPAIKQVLACYVRLKEILFAPFFDHFFLAERCYRNELNFVGRNYTIVENKYADGNFISTSERSAGKLLTLIYTGTIAEEYGVFDAVKFTGKLKRHIPDVHLKIVGYCPNTRTYNRIKKEIQSLTYVSLTGGEEPVPHNKILAELKAADLAILPYRLNSYYSNRIPTKIYECLSLKIPMVIPKNPSWQFLFDQFDAFVFTDFTTADIQLAQQMKHRRFYTKGNTEWASWDSEKGKVTDVVSRLLND